MLYALTLNFKNTQYSVIEHRNTGVGRGGGGSHIDMVSVSVK